MTDDSSWKKADVVMPMVIHVFKDYNSKAKFDTIFDPTFGMFKDIASAGGVLPPSSNSSWVRSQVRAKAPGS